MRQILLFALLCDAAPCLGEADPDWLYQDGQVTPSEATDLRGQESKRGWGFDSTEFNGRIHTQAATRTDSTAHFQKPRWSSQFQVEQASGSVQGDSSLREAQGQWKGDPWSWGVGHWRGSTLQLPWPADTHLGAWCVGRFNPFRMGLMGSRDSTSLALGEWKTRNRSVLSAAWLQGPRSRALLLASRFKDWNFWAWSPLADHHFYGAMQASASLTNNTKLRWKGMWNQTDTAQRHVSSAMGLSQMRGNWSTLLENRWIQLVDSTTEWIMQARAVRKGENAELHGEYSVRGEHEEPPLHFLRLGSQWGTAPTGWRMLGWFQWQPLHHKEWERNPQIESGFLFLIQDRQFARFSLVLPRSFARFHRAQIRGFVEGPCGKYSSILLRWSMDWNLDQQPSFSETRIFLTWKTEL